MSQPKIIAYLKPSCGWSMGVRAVLKKYELPYEDRDIITAQQKNLALDPAFKMMPFGIDAALSQFRWAVNQRLEEEKEQSLPVAQGA